ncbi:MAG: hypothetical protein M3Q48_11465 [Actinomycetota bacterium]|nr:hypothetical protein [Actinomycetota bacterium]
MASEEHEVQLKGRRRRRRDPESRRQEPENTPQGDASPGLLRLLWADLRKQQLPRPLEPEELAWIEAEEELRRQAEEEATRAHSISSEHIDALRRRYTAGAS